MDKVPCHILYGTAALLDRLCVAMLAISAIAIFPFISAGREGNYVDEDEEWSTSTLISPSPPRGDPCSIVCTVLMDVVLHFSSLPSLTS